MSDNDFRYSVVILLILILLFGCALPGTIEKHDGYEIHNEWSTKP
jgi:hypothetical protein